MEDLYLVRTARDLKSFVQELPDDMPVYLFTNGTVYDIIVEVAEKRCCEHSGKQWTTPKAIVFEVD